MTDFQVHLKSDKISAEQNSLKHVRYCFLHLQQVVIYDLTLGYINTDVQKQAEHINAM
jgi:hypothetical protein